MCCITKCLLYLAHVLNCIFYLEVSMCCFAKHVLYLALVFNLVCCALYPIVLVTFVASLFSTSALWHLCCLVPLLFGTSVIWHLCYLAAVTTNPTASSHTCGRRHSILDKCADEIKFNILLIFSVKCMIIEHKINKYEIFCAIPQC